MTKFNHRVSFSASAISDYTITGVSVITEGPALGHGVMIDAATIESVKACAEQYAGGLKVKMNHGEGADSICGILRNFRVDGAQLRADLRLLKSSDDTPKILEMAEMMPESFGLSISFSGQVEEIDGAKFVRCLEIYSCDIVDEPAANPNGLFSKIDKTNQGNPMIIETPEYLALQAEHKKTCEDALTLKTSFEEVTKAKLELEARLSEASAKITEFEKQIVEAKEAAAKQDEEHKKALSDFEAKVAEAAERQLAASGAQPVKLGAESADADARLYDEFSKAGPAERATMFSDPSKRARIQRESARRTSSK